MKAHTFTETVVVTDEEHRMLKEISEVNYLFNFDGPDSQLELCDSLRGKGLVKEDGDGRVSITIRGRHFLANCI
jgi:hypothetical protein